MIFEGLISTVDPNGKPRLAAMGAVSTPAFSEFELRPFDQSQTHANLMRDDHAVFHLTDDVGQIVSTITGQQPPSEEWNLASQIDGFVYAGACRWFELAIVFRDSQSPRASVQCRVIHCGEIRPFLGFNRAKHLVLEAAILATRVDFIPAAELRSKWQWFGPIIQKTGGPSEWDAFERLTEFVAAKTNPAFPQLH